MPFFKSDGSESFRADHPWPLTPLLSSPVGEKKGVCLCGIPYHYGPCLRSFLLRQVECSPPPPPPTIPFPSSFLEIASIKMGLGDKEEGGKRRRGKKGYKRKRGIFFLPPKKEMKGNQSGIIASYCPGLELGRKLR